MIPGPLRTCYQPGCGKTTANRYCEKHARTNAETKDPMAAMYNTTAHERFRAAILMQNPICQKLDAKGEQCHNPGKIIHHLVSPRFWPAGFFDPKNVAILCAHCHPTDVGTPWWRVGVDYVATVYKVSV
jgi:hypothetical protein